MQEEIKVQDYGYTSNSSKVEIDGQMLLAMLNFFNGIVQKETQDVMLYQSPKIEKSKVVYKPLEDTNAFFTQTPQSALTLFGTKAMDFLYVLEDIHRQAIIDGIATKNETIGKFSLEDV